MSLAQPKIASHQSSMIDTSPDQVLAQADIRLSTILRELMEARHLDPGDLAERVGVTYQTVKRVLDGESVNARFITSLIDQFGLTKEPKVLRRVLLAFLSVQFKLSTENTPRTGERLLRQAGLIGESG